MKNTILITSICVLLIVATKGVVTMSDNNLTNPSGASKNAIATFGGGCFWCMQPPFDSTDGVILTRVGYTGGHLKNPAYPDVITGKTGHIEAIEVVYDPQKVSYETLLTVFWKNIDPTVENQQFNDKGTHYQTAIFTHTAAQEKAAQKSKADLDASKKFDTPIKTQIRPAETFYIAEDYHQKYYEKNVLHYQFYKVGSGREAYLKRVWGNEN